MSSFNSGHSFLSFSPSERKSYPPPKCFARASSKHSKPAVALPPALATGPVPATKNSPKANSSTNPLPPGQSRKWEDWELPCYVTSFLTIVILGVRHNAKSDLTIETWAHQKALERLEIEHACLSAESE
ncbi:putative NADH:ubiquinone reductase (H(+)-translocating) [Rosa chinensis]|uniref:Putative NADH:ubiquinone reductase (H(+)-translocating) n=1 Tax=Rosa chinensis TaxID=74649 RepID=A0A2P6QGY9_ROSCH|nr:uncharacterized protein LOC112163796 [Rosa chinensis]PRQ33445.1 putative NADH:ubiquinone reductase (H(+)-translocating) [Rosa chinensis]